MANTTLGLLDGEAANTAELLAYRGVASCGARRRIGYTAYSAPRSRLALRSSVLPSMNPKEFIDG